MLLTKEMTSYVVKMKVDVVKLMVGWQKSVIISACDPGSENEDWVKNRFFGGRTHMKGQWLLGFECKGRINHNSGNNKSVGVPDVNDNGERLA